jgi:hypothetical protein
MWPSPHTGLCGAIVMMPDRDILKPRPEGFTMQLTPLVADVHRNGPTPVERP